MYITSTPTHIVFYLHLPWSGKCPSDELMSCVVEPPRPTLVRNVDLHSAARGAFFFSFFLFAFLFRKVYFCIIIIITASPPPAAAPLSALSLSLSFASSSDFLVCVCRYVKMQFPAVAVSAARKTPRRDPHQTDRRCSFLTLVHFLSVLCKEGCVFVYRESITRKASRDHRRRRCCCWSLIIMIMMMMLIMTTTTTPFRLLLQISTDCYRLLQIDETHLWYNSFCFLFSLCVASSPRILGPPHQRAGR